MRLTHAVPITATIGLMLAVFGCTTPAYREVYKEKLNSEVRTLEDQLYEADYENRVLRDELNACRDRKKCIPQDVSLSTPKPPMINTVESYRSQPPIFDPPESPPVYEDEFYDKRNDKFDDEFDLGVDMGDPMPNPSGGSADQKAGDSRDQKSDSTMKPSFDFDPEKPFSPLTDPNNDDILPPIETPPPPSRKAPALPTPPDMKDLLPDPIIDGNVLPPPQKPDIEDLPPGKIELPDFGGGPFDSGPPVAIRVHPGGGGGVEDDEEVFWITLEAVDESGRVVDLANFDIEADLSIVVTDPASELPDSAEPVVLGRWDFDPVQTAGMVGDMPVHGIHVPVKWENRRPVGDQVVVRANLRGGEDILRCEGLLPTVRQARLASEWLPRGDRK